MMQAGEQAAARTMTGSITSSRAGSLTSAVSLP